ncbi:MAG TPA: helix-turn-helix transcriptional regulator [Alphaproteobacteria bacterium]|jgi:phage repressor protein C with HTH and peptisase S24 domain|nr:helix-turn-helix transcriptional regulator [Micavibrio sp.]MBK9561755.1 helix-turn-helix transcriptional regulator [Micavibrio sp.]HQX26624.1 helix-turn-helix transcriptional regulator [Alphaproteobacteria bacterium]
MFSHKDIWRGIDRLAASCGYSASGLAKKAGLDPTSFNKSKRLSPDGKPRWPSTESLSKILSVTGATMTDFISLIDADNDNENSALRTIPMVGFAQAGKAGFFDEDGYPSGNGWDEVAFPNAEYQNSKSIFALQVSGDSMQPLYRDGDILVISAQERIRKGDRVIVKTKNGEVIAKELIKQSAGKISLKSLNPAFEDRSLTLDEVGWMARILWVSQ